jgi:sirohydrochlorin ferrochelatase
MAVKKSGKLFLVISRKKLAPAARHALSRMFEDRSGEVVRIILVNSGKANAVASALQQGVQTGAKEIYILPLGALPKRALRDDIPVAVRRVREKNMAVDFHYAGNIFEGLGKRSG